VGRGGEVRRVSPEDVGLTDLEYQTLRALMEGNAIESFPDGWNEAVMDLLELGLVDERAHPPSLNSRDGARGTQSPRGAARPDAGPPFVVSPEGYRLLARVGIFRIPAARSVVVPSPPSWFNPSDPVAAVMGWTVGVTVAFVVGVALGAWVF